MLIELAKNKFARSTIKIAGLSLLFALIATVTCEGPIDTIFMNWRDNTACAYKTYGCIIGVSDTSNKADGAIVLAIFLILTAIIYTILLIVKRLIKKLKND